MFIYTLPNVYLGLRKSKSGDEAKLIPKKTKNNIQFKSKKYPNPRCTFSHKSPYENAGQFYFNIFFTHFRENQFLGKLLLLIHLHFNPDEDDQLISLISTSRKYELDPRSLRYRRHAGRHRICWKSLDYWLTLSATAGCMVGGIMDRA